jgi:hypothetical protein
MSMVHSVVRARAVRADARSPRRDLSRRAAPAVSLSPRRYPVKRPPGVPLDASWMGEGGWSWFHAWCPAYLGACSICDMWPELRGAFEFRRRSHLWLRGRRWFA